MRRDLPRRLKLMRARVSVSSDQHCKLALDPQVLYLLHTENVAMGGKLTVSKI